MKVSTVVAALVLVAGCTKEPPVPSNWATTVTRARDGVEPSCEQQTELPIPTGGDAQSLSRFGNSAVDAFAKLKELKEKCATWAKGQRQ